MAKHEEGQVGNPGERRYEKRSGMLPGASAGGKAIVSKNKGILPGNTKASSQKAKDAQKRRMAALNRTKVEKPTSGKGGQTDFSKPQAPATIGEGVDVTDRVEKMKDKYKKSSY